MEDSKETASSNQNSSDAHMDSKDCGNMLKTFTGSSQRDPQYREGEVDPPLIRKLFKIDTCCKGKIPVVLWR